MNIAIIGAGNVGGALAKQFAKAGHQIFLGVRDSENSQVKELLSENITSHSISEAVSQAEVIVIATPAPTTKDVANQIGDASNKIIIDANNSFFADQSPYKTSAEAFADLTKCPDVVKCFNTIGANNMVDPKFKDQAADMFVAGDSQKGKEVATQLAKEIGFDEVWDLGGNDRFELIEKIAEIWITLAMKQGYGRGIGFKILKK